MAIRSRSGEHRHPIRVATRRTGLSADLLRAWEKRYEVVKPARSESGRRLYSDADLHRLQLLYRATLAGRSIGQVAELPTDALATLVRRDAAADGELERETGRAQRPERRTSPPAARLLTDCVRAMERLDAAELDAILRRAGVALPLATLLDALVVPLLERVGMGWREGTLRPVHGHTASVALRRVLDRAIQSANSPFATANLVVATPAGQIHEFGALLVAATAVGEGWRVTYLGADLPAEDIAEAAGRTQARAVALSVIYPPADRAVSDELRRLGTALAKDVAVLVGGAAASAYAAVLDEIGAVRLNDLEDFRGQLVTFRRRRQRRR
ncbi:MAG: cobalamin-dependent protein [Gemmatimonadota bacterium]|nr:cobalamin-dependent protein [Gemmatimonadota bacterium]